ncbi:hypothetical protein HOP50_17g79720 [Chloropicon primus]|uniref:Kazal-like domain-containing protein n=1 Tax=Chloropicon primus TaxID=1764295 RepID=A0A5B8MYJ4_9CHLO|nr:hypothetical protein A3770_17p79490 [Chloropicon primus]UPR04628.1 hypothetical protein HOP50_17g79720 [Chloropicon primus]|eukprot:QDZ25431.1 hypothetical protein A3770_17p79490 [Chloropicon primus]
MKRTSWMSAVVLAAVLVVCLGGQGAEAFLPRWWPAGGATGGDPAAVPAAAECPADVIERLQTLSFEELKLVCPTRSDVPHDLATCSQCSCGAYKLIKEAVGTSDEDIHALAERCGPIVSIDTAFDGLNLKAVVDFLNLCKEVPEQVDFKTCEPVEVSAMSGPSDNINADALLSFLRTDLNGITEDEMIQFLGVAQDLDLADNHDGLVDDVSKTVAEVENFVRLVNLGQNVVPESMNDSSILCPGFTSEGSCETFEELRRICPWSCERQKEECSMATPETCGESVFLEACPVTCRQLQVLTSNLPITLDGAIQITSLTDGTAIKTNNLKGSVEQGCMCFNVFQPVCNKETGEMYANLCEAECNGVHENTGPCRETSMDSVMKFAATQSSMTPEEIQRMVDGHNHNHVKQHHNLQEAKDVKSQTNAGVGLSSFALLPLSLALSSAYFGLL